MNNGQQLSSDPDQWLSQALYLDKRLGANRLLDRILGNLQSSGLNYEMGMVTLANAIACATAMHVVGSDQCRQLSIAEMQRALACADSVRELIEARLRSYGVG